MPAASVLLAVSALAALAASAPPPAGAPAPRQPAVRIALRPEVEVTGRHVVLGDVAIVTTLDLALLERLVEVPLGPAPRAGATARLERRALLRWIRARAAIREDEVAWDGPEESVVRAAVREVSGDAIADAARARLREVLARFGELELTLAEPPRSVSIPAGAVALRARTAPQGPAPARRQSVWVDVFVDDRFARTVPVTFEVGGAAAAPVVRRGGWATLRAGQGAVRLESRVEVLEDGWSGQSVRVRLPSATGAIVARVTGPATVEVER